MVRMARGTHHYVENWQRYQRELKVVRIITLFGKDCVTERCEQSLRSIVAYVVQIFASKAGPENRPANTSSFSVAMACSRRCGWAVAAKLSRAVVGYEPEYRWTGVGILRDQTPTLPGHRIGHINQYSAFRHNRLKQRFEKGIMRTPSTT